MYGNLGGRHHPHRGSPHAPPSSTLMGLPTIGAKHQLPRRQPSGAAATRIAYLSRSLHSIDGPSFASCVRADARPPPPPPPMQTSLHGSLAAAAQQRFLSTSSTILSRGLAGSYGSIPRADDDEEEERLGDVEVPRVVLRAETRPVIRRRRYKHRKSATLEPETSVILARGLNSSSSSEEECVVEQRPRLRGPSARRSSAARRNAHKRAHLSMNCLSLLKEDDPPAPSFLDPRHKSMSVSELPTNEDDLDFRSEASVTRWTSRMLAELESLPGSRLDLAASAGDLLKPSPAPPPVPPHSTRMRDSTASLYSSVTSINGPPSSLMTSSVASTLPSSMTSSMVSSMTSSFLSSTASPSNLNLNGSSSPFLQTADTAMSPCDAQMLRSSILSLTSVVSDTASVNTLKMDDSEGSTTEVEGGADSDGNKVEVEVVVMRPEAIPDVVPRRNAVARKKAEKMKGGDQSKSTRNSLPVLEDDRYPLLQSIYRLTKSVYGEIPDEEDANGNRESTLKKWQRSKAECRERQRSAAAYTSSVSEAPSTPSVESPGVPPPSVDHVVASLLKAVEQTKRPRSAGRDATTQTSPPLSRSSSFDWLEAEASPGERRTDERSIADLTALPVSTIERTLDILHDDSTTSSGEDAADREVRAVTEAGEKKKMRLDANLDDGLALLQYFAADNGVATTASSSNGSGPRPVSHRTSRIPSRLLPESAGSADGHHRNFFTASARSNSSTMSDSVYDNVASPDRSQDEDDHEPIMGRMKKDLLLDATTSSRPTSTAFSPQASVRSNHTANQPSSPSIAPYNSSQFEFKLQKAEAKASESCRWLRSAGFPQYASAYEEGAFPLQLDVVLADHRGILDSDSVHALSKRIATLNRCAIMKIDGVVLRDRASIDADPWLSRHADEDGVALSGHWRFQRHSQTWSRTHDIRLPPQYPGSPKIRDHPDSPTHHMNGVTNGVSTAANGGGLPRTDPPASPLGERKSLLQRSHSERIKERAKAIIKKMDVRSKPRKEDNKPPLLISDPVLLSYDSASPRSMRLFPESSAVGSSSSSSTASSRLPSTTMNGGSKAPLPSSSSSSSRSKSAGRRQGIVFIPPSSPDSSDEPRRLSRYGEGAPVRSLAGIRDRSVPSRFRDSTTSIRRDIQPPQDYLYPARDRLSRAPPLPSSSSSTISHRPEISSPILLRRGAFDPSPAPFMTPPFDRRRHAPVQDARLSTPFAMHADCSPLESRRLNGSSSSFIPSSSPLLAVDTLDRSDDERLRLDGHRRDSGVGSSLSRSPSVPSAVRLRQSILTSTMPLSNSFSSSINSSCSSSWSRKRPTALPQLNLKESTDLFLSDLQLPASVDTLSVIETSKLRQLVYLKLTALLEKHISTESTINIELDGSGGASGPTSKNWTVQKLLKKIKTLDVKGNGSPKDENVVFGQSLSTIRRRTGLCLPRTILEVLRYLRIHAAETVGMFRKNGVRSRIAELRSIADKESEVDVFVEENTLNSGQVHDVADLLKQYLRELPEPLMTNALSKTFANIYEHLPIEDRLIATRYAVVLLPEENREALQTLLFFLADVASHAETNNMHPDNLSVCLAPSLFQLSASRLNTVTASRRHKTIGGTGMPTEAEMRETRAAQMALSAMITHATALFITSETLPKDYTVGEYEADAPVLKMLGGSLGPRSYLANKLRSLVKEHDDRWRGWIVEGTSDGVEMSTKKSTDLHPLPLFRVWVDVDAPPKEVLTRLAKERYVWDTALVNYRFMDSIFVDTELYQYVVNDTVGHPTRDCFVVRMQRSDMAEIRGACALVERSVQCSETQLLGGVSAAILDSRYLIEPHAQGRSRLTHISRVDLRGRRPAWYSQHYAHMVARQLGRLRNSFKQPVDDGPETKV